MIAMSGQLDVSTTSQGSCAVVRVDGEIDLDSAGELSEAAVAALQEIGPSLVLDLSGVTFMDSTGLKVLLAVHKRAELAGGRLVLAAPTRSVNRVVSVTGFDRTLAVAETVEAAVAVCAGDAPEATAAALQPAAPVTPAAPG
jgi:anti-sigma B factor antagonist